MENKLIEIILMLILAACLGIVAQLLADNRKRILQAITDLVQKVEAAVQGSGMGEEKKKLVLAQLEVMGIRATAWVMAMIDSIVAQLNARRAWLTEQAGDGLGGAGNGAD